MSQKRKPIEVDIRSIKNRNEPVVAECIREELGARPELEFSEKMLYDVYAYALNSLPPRYAHDGTIVLGNRPNKEDIAKIVHEGIELVFHNPKT